MTHSIQPIGISPHSGLDTPTRASITATRMMKDLDTDNTGKVTRDQFISVMTAKGMSTADAARTYDAMDAQKTGAIDQADIEAAIRSSNLKPARDGPLQGAISSNDSKVTEASTLGSNVDELV